MNIYSINNDLDNDFAVTFDADLFDTLDDSNCCYGDVDYFECECEKCEYITYMQNKYEQQCDDDIYYNNLI